MSPLKTIFTTVYLLLTLFSSAQIRLAEIKPKAGAIVTFTYDPKGNSFGGKPPYTLIYFLDNDRFPVADVNLTSKGTVLEGKFTIPNNATAFCIKMTDGKHIENDKGYLFAVYKGMFPVEGAYASTAYATGLGAEIFGIKKNIVSSALYYKKEFRAHPELEKQYEDLYLLTLSYSSAADQELAVKRVRALEKSHAEKSLISALDYYRHNKNTKAADALLKLIKSRFPNGQEAYSELSDAFDEEQNAEKKDSLYHILDSKYPPKDKASSIVYDFKRIQLALAHLDKGDWDGFEQWERQINNKSALSGGINDIAKSWAEKGQQLDKAEKGIRKALEFADSAKQIILPQMYQSPNQARDNNRKKYERCLDTYALILFEEKRYREALAVAQSIYENHGPRDAEQSTHYALILNANGLFYKSLKETEKSFTLGINSPTLTAQLAITYARLNGSSKGYNVYIDSLSRLATLQRMVETGRTMISLTAPAFNLRDSSGKQVTLASLKGKVVVIDFWANWCGPCKESFPGMQSVIEHYKSDPSVQFLFIDTWENGNTYVTDTKKYTAANHFDFNVLFDEKADNGKLAKIRTIYGVDALPTKFVIDKNGTIRFKNLGYSGSAESLADELICMVELAKQQ